MKALLLAAALLFIGARDVHAGACARIGLEAQILAHKADVIPAGGGILVGTAPAQSYQDGMDGGDPSSHTDWKLRLKKKKLRTVVTTLAPGLTVYTTKTRGKVTLVDGKGKKLGTYAMSGKKSPFTVAAPVLKDVTITRYQGSRSGTQTVARATLADKPPADAYALVIYEGATALSWTVVDGSDATALTVYASPGRCGAQPAGMTAPYASQQIEAAWVDRFGRVSAHGAAVVATDASSGTTVGP